MKKLVFYLMMGFMFSFLTGCNMDDDGYSLNDAWVGFGLVQKDDDAGAYKIVMDDDEVLFPVTSDNWWHEVKNNDRVLVNFTILGNKNNENHDEHYYVKINSLRKILYKGILDITPAIEDSIGNDPIQVKDKWIKKNMLNFELLYLGGGKTHFINLVKKPGAITTEPVILELRHNNNNDKEMIKMSAIVTFDLSALKVQGKTSTKFKVIAKSYAFDSGNDFEYTGEYKY
jgi:hypothetical protein